MIRTLPAWLLAALIALTGAAGVLAVAGGTTVPLGGTDLPLAYVLPPLVGLALFQLVFGTLAGRWRGLRYWLIALPLSAVIWGGALVLLLDGRLTVGQALAAAVAGHLAAGLVALAAGSRR